MVPETQSLRRPRPVSAQQTVAKQLNNPPTSQGKVVYPSVSREYPSPSRFLTSTADQPTEKAHFRLRFSPRNADTVPPGTTKKALERFRSLEALSTTSNTTPLHSGSTRRPPTFDVTWMNLPTSHDDVRQSTRRRAAVHHDPASKNKDNGLTERSTDDTRRLDTTDDSTQQLDSLPRFTSALTKFRSMEDLMGQTLSACQGGVSSKPGLVVRRLSRLSGAEWSSSVTESDASSPPNVSRQQIIDRSSAATSDDLRRAISPNPPRSASPESTISRPFGQSELPKYQSLGRTSTDLTGSPPFVPRLPHWPPQDVGVPSFASRRSYSVSEVAAAVKDDENLRPSSTTVPPSCTRTAARPPSQTAVVGADVATVEGVPTTMTSSLYVQLQKSRRVTSVASRCSIRVLLTNYCRSPDD